MNSNNPLLQLIQGQQLIQQRPTMAQTSTHQTTQQFVSSTTPPIMKPNKVPQQILPKPSNSGSIIHSTTTKTVVTQSKTAISQQFQTSQHSTPSSSPQHQQVNTGNGQNSSILLPSSNLNSQPQLMLNQMPMLVQQNTQGVQLILRPPTPQLNTPSLVIHNRQQPQLQQPQPQQLLRILNTNGGMQLAANTPTFIVSSQV